MKIPPIEWARSEANRLLFNFVPREFRHSVTLDKEFGYLVVRLGDGTPECKVDALKFIDWLKGTNATWEQLQDFCFRRSGQSKQSRFNF